MVKAGVCKTPIMGSNPIVASTRTVRRAQNQLLVLGPFPPGAVASDPPDATDGAYAHGFGVAHFGLRVLDVALAVRELKEAGVKILSDPVFEDSGLTYAYVAAPDGVVVELTQYG